MGSSTTVIGGEYLVLGKIGEGSFGEVFRATHIDSGIDYAIKREPINVSHPQLEHEAKMYRDLAGGVGIAKMHWFGKEGAYNAMVIDLLGPNLKQVRRENEKFPLSFVIEVGTQMISQIENIHKKGIVYRDVKPENFLLDVDIILPDAPLSGKTQTPPTYPDHIMRFFNDTRQRQLSIESDLSISPSSPIKPNYCKPILSIVDFGLASYYRDPSGKHIPNKGSTKHKVGTARYASINIHCGREHTRRDDIESIGYLLLEFLIGTLPWSGISARNSRQGWAKMREIKEDIELDELCDGLPKGFMTFIGYTRSLKFDEEPDYEYLRTILTSCAGRGPEAQTVRCYREPVLSRSLEQTFGGMPIQQRPNDPFKTKERSKGDNPLKDWRTRPQYSPPHKDLPRHQRYSPNSLWTTTPPDLLKENPFTSSQDFVKEMKDKIEWDTSPDMYPDQDTDRSSLHDENQEGYSRIQSRNRKSSWGEDDPNARWGNEEEDSLPVQIGSFQEEPDLTNLDNKHLNSYSKASIQNFGRQFAPQDARLYLSDPPPGLTPRLGNGSGFIPINSSQQLSAKSNRQYTNHTNHTKANSTSVHPLVKEHTSSLPPPPPLSPKSMSSALSSMSIKDDIHEEPGIERSQYSANRSHNGDAHPTGEGSPTKGQGYKYSNSYNNRRGSFGPGDQPSSFEGLPWDSGRNQHNVNGKGGESISSSYPNSYYGKNRGGSENWQFDHRGSQSRSNRRNNSNLNGSSVENNNISNGSFESHSRQVSAPGTRVQQGLTTQPPKQQQQQQQQQGFQYHNHNHNYHHHHHHHHHHYHHSPFNGQSSQGSHKDGQGQSRSIGPTGFGEHRRQSRSRKCSNSSLSGLVDHWGTNKQGGGGGGNAQRVVKPK